MYNSFFYQSNRQTEQNHTSLIEQTEQLFKANMAFLARELPELQQTLLSCKTNRYSLFINDADLLNIRDNHSGEALYSRQPAAEVSDEVSSFLKRPVALCRHSTLVRTEADCLPDKAVVMVFGVASGYHLKQLLQSNKLAALLIYEADIELLKQSLNFIVWQDLLEIANKNNVLLAIQPDYAVGNIKQHLAELDAAGLFSDNIYLYRHTFHPLTEEVIRFLLVSSGDNQALLHGEGRFLGLKAEHEYLPVRPTNILGNAVPDFTVAAKHQLILNRNLAKLQAFYPDIAAFYENYQPQRWQFCVDETGQENIFHLSSRTLAYRDGSTEAELLTQLFKQNPFRDSAIYSQSFQEKLSKYIHFQQIFEVEKLQKLLPKTEKFSIQDIRTLAFFGTGLAGHIELTLNDLSPLNIFIFEEDPDLFYASLYVTDWAELIEKSNASNGHLYFNIGCSPDTYLNYFLYQLYIVGAYEISNTFLFPCYYRPHLQKAIGNLRDQLKTFIALNEYYDNARYGITHFLHNAQDGALFYRQRQQKTTYSCPVFIIGNGPSLDELVEHIRQHQADAIIISCGTALKALYEYGITPDFHAEAEQNSATYNWITKVPDRAYLRSVHFLSTAAAFPKTAKLFKSACLAFNVSHIPFKVLAQVDNVLAQKMCQLKYAFPTVSNFAVNLALSIGFENIYLFGVDLGFADVDHHHSKKSAYYTVQGDSLHDYAKHVGRQIPVKGNFSSYVFTKFEFNMARKVMEQAVASYQQSSQVFNCSAGAFIEGSLPLPAEDILIKSQSGQKASALENLVTENFSTIPGAALDQYKNFIVSELPLVVDVITQWLEIVLVDVKNEIEAKELIAKQAIFLKSLYSKNSRLAHFLLEGSAYSFLGLMNSFVNTLKENQDFELFNQLVKIWQDYLLMVKNDLADILGEACPVAGLVG